MAYDTQVIIELGKTYREGKLLVLKVSILKTDP